MPTKQQEKKSPDQATQDCQQRNAVIGKHVLRTLGQPGDLYSLQVRQLWGDHYRVNVLVGADATSTKVAHSYFVVADGDGNILASTPKIATTYAPAPEARA
jgi:hypothetical protein